MAQIQLKMKRHLHNSFRALFLSLAVLLSLPVLAVKVEIDGINYELVAKIKEATVTYGKYSGEVVIPESVEHEGTTYSVTSIGEDAFAGDALTSVTIGNSVTSIGDGAFSSCRGLTSVTIPNSVMSIGDEAFAGCDGLTSVTIGNSVTSIGNAAFAGCDGLTSVTIPNSVKSIGDEAFYYCSGLTSVTIPNSVTSIGDRAFFYCTALTSVHISDIATWCNIEFGDDYSNPLFYTDHLYMNGEEVKDLVIPNSVTSIGDRAFYYCRGLTSVTIPNSVTSIGESAFYNCDGLTSVTIGNSVTSIGGWAFGRCSGLTSVTIPNSVTSIGAYAFEYSYGLTSVTIGNSVTSIGCYAFIHCYGLTSVHISDIAAWCNIKYDADPFSYAYHLYLNGEEVKDLVIPNSVTSIGNFAFAYCSGLTSVTIPNSVTSIGLYAFYECSGLTSVTIGSGVKYIYALAFGKCPELLDVYCYAENVPSTDVSAFYGSYPEYANLHVPDGSIESYKAKSPWSKFGKIVALTEEETGIDEVKCENGKVKTAVYDLSGRRVQKAQKGIFIQNGKLMVK